MSEDEKIAFIPYALKDYDDYTVKVKEAFAGMGYNNVVSVHTYEEPSRLLLDVKVKAVFIGGGNTFRLLDKLCKTNGLLPLIRSNVGCGQMKYIGSSAGSNMACPTIKTTNDMPIVYPPQFKALGFVNFQINPHFVPGGLVATHMGETRETRIKEYHEENDYPVIGLTEANWITVNGESAILHGARYAFLFEKGKDIQVWLPETELKVG